MARRLLRHHGRSIAAGRRALAGLHDRPVLNQFDRLQQADAPHVADPGMPLRQRIEAGAELRAAGVHMRVASVGMRSRSASAAAPGRGSARRWSYRTPS